MILVISYQVSFQKISNFPASQGGLFSLSPSFPFETPVELHTFPKNLPLSPRPQQPQQGVYWYFWNHAQWFCYLCILWQSLTHKNPQRQKIIHGMCPAGCKHRSIDLNICFCRNVLFRKFLWQLLWLLFNEIYFFKSLLCFKIEGLYFNFSIL